MVAPKDQNTEAGSIVCAVGCARDRGESFGFYSVLGKIGRPARDIPSDRVREPVVFVQQLSEKCAPQGVFVG